MGTINSAKAKFGLQAVGSPTSTNVSGLSRVGEWPGNVSFPGADIAYSFEVAATGSGDAFELDAQSGVVTATVGAPTITDGDGKDFEGADLPSVSKIDAVLLSTPSGNAGVVTSGTPGYLWPVAMGPSQTNLCLSGPITLTPPEWTGTFSDAGDVIAVTIVASST